MKKLFFLFILLISTINSYSQSMSVASFKELPNDMDARVSFPKDDSNNEKAAIIKIVTKEQNFSFDVGMLGVVDVVQKVGEVWVYVPKYIKYITIKHQQLGVLRDYFFSIPIKSATVYELVLTTNQVISVVNENAGGQYLVVNATPSEVEVTVDNGEPTTITGGEGSIFLTYGEHTYTVRSKLYKSESGVITIGEERKELNINLEPNFGYIDITSTPTGADIDLNGIVVGQTPYRSERLELGEYQVKISTPNYEIYSQTINLIEGEKRENLAAPLKANFGYIQINSIPSGATVEINDMAVGKTPYKSGILPLGEHRIKVSATNFDTYSQNINLTEGGATVEITPQLTSYLSNIKINCVVDDASIVINGERRGRGSWSGDLTPGTYELKAEKDGHRPTVRKLVVQRSTPQSITLNAPTPMYGTLNISAEQNGVVASMSGKTLGSLPNIFQKVLVGKHTITLSKEGYVSENATIEITEGKITEYKQKALMSVEDSEEYKAAQRAAAEAEAKRKAAEAERLRVTAWQRESAMYILPQVGYDISNSTLSYGAMIGWSKRFGGYVKYMSNFKSAESTSLECNNDGVLSGEGSDLIEPNYKESTISLYTATAGVIYRVKPWLSVYAGGGVGNRVVEYELLSGEYVKNTDATVDMSYSLDAGALMRFGGFSMSIGLNSVAMKYSQINLGVGVNF